MIALVGFLLVVVGTIVWLIAEAKQAPLRDEDYDETFTSAVCMPDDGDAVLAFQVSEIARHEHAGALG